MNKEYFLDVLNKELAIALGCTEPIAIAYAAALARKYVRGSRVTSIKVAASGNVIKNALSVCIPGTGSSGINLAAVLGALVNDAGKRLEVLTGLTKSDIENAKEMVREGISNVEIAETQKKLFIEVTVRTEASMSRVVIEDTHTNVTCIEVDGQVVIQEFSNDEINAYEIQYDLLNLNSIWDFIENIDTKELGIVVKSIEMNRKIGEEGLRNAYGLQIGKTIKENMNRGIIAADAANYAAALTAAGSDARMAGSMFPVMSNTGSGNQGISATLPVTAIAEKLDISGEKLIRAVTLSHLITIYIKSKFGRLSALCGVTISATGASCGIAYLLGGGKGEIRASIQNMLGNVTGMLCDGAKPGCALKVSTCTNAAVHSAIIAVQGIEIKSTDGIIENDPEQTISNLCMLGNQGTLEADRIILEIMLKKSNC